MSNVQTIYLIANTSDTKSAGSNGSFELEVILDDGTVLDLDSDSDSRSAKYGSKDDSGDAATWIWNSDKFSSPFSADQVTSMIIDFNSKNAWLPASIFCIFEDSDGAYTLKSACGNWGENDSFSTDTSDFDGTAKKERYILQNNVSSCGTAAG